MGGPIGVEVGRAYIHIHRYTYIYILMYTYTCKASYLQVSDGGGVGGPIGVEVGRAAGQQALTHRHAQTHAGQETRRLARREQLQGEEKGREERGRKTGWRI